MADAIAAKVIAGNGPKTEMSVSGNQVTLTLDSGYYLVVVTSNNGNTKVYQTLLVDATPDIDKNGAYVTRAFENTAVKVQPVSKPDKQILDAGGNPLPTPAIQRPIFILLAISRSSVSRARCRVIRLTPRMLCIKSPTSRMPVCQSI